MSLVTKSQVAGKSDNDIFLVFVDLHNKNKKNTLCGLRQAKSISTKLKKVITNLLSKLKGVLNNTNTTERVHHDTKGVFSTKGVYSIC